MHRSRHSLTCVHHQYKQHIETMNINLLAVDISATKVLRAHDLTSGGLYQRRTTQEDGTIACTTLIKRTLIILDTKWMKVICVDGTTRS